MEDKLVIGGDFNEEIVYKEIYLQTSQKINLSVFIDKVNVPFYRIKQIK